MIDAFWRDVSERAEYVLADGAVVLATIYPQMSGEFKVVAVGRIQMWAKPLADVRLEVEAIFAQLAANDRLDKVVKAAAAQGTSPSGTIQASAVSTLVAPAIPEVDPLPPVRRRRKSQPRITGGMTRTTRNEFLSTAEEAEEIARLAIEADMSKSKWMCLASRLAPVSGQIDRVVLRNLIAGQLRLVEQLAAIEVAVMANAESAEALKTFPGLIEQCYGLIDEAHHAMQMATRHGVKNGQTRKGMVMAAAAEEQPEQELWSSPTRSKSSSVSAGGMA